MFWKRQTEIDKLLSMRRMSLDHPANGSQVFGSEMLVLCLISNFETIRIDHSGAGFYDNHSMWCRSNDAFENEEPQRRGRAAMGRVKNSQ